MKKVFIFAGRTHHFQKLQPIYQALENTGHEPWFLIANNAINIDPATEFLTDSGYRFAHLYNYISGPIDRQEIIPPPYMMNIAPFWFEFSLHEAREVYAATVEFLKIEQPDAVLGLHENNFWVKTIAYLCQRAEVPHYVFQEGLLRARDQQTMRKQSSACEYSTRIFAWGEDAATQYVSAGIERDRIVVSGPMHMDAWTTLRNDQEAFEGLRHNVRVMHRATPSTPVVVFAPPILNQYLGDIVQDLKILTEFLSESGTLLILRCHPFESKETIGRILKEVDARNIRTNFSKDPLELICGSDLVLTQHSTIGIEALALGIPIVEFNMSKRPVLQSWAKQRLAEEIVTKDDFVTISKTLAGKQNLDVDWLNDRVTALMRCDGLAVQRCLEVILDES